MATNGQRLYSVLTRKDVGEKMMKEIDQISEVFSLSKSDAIVILTHLRWNSFKVSDRLGDDKERFLAELGLVRVSDMSQENESIACFADHKTNSDGVGDYLVSTPFCSHKFCITCWRDYLNELLEKKKNNNEEDGAVAVLCPNPDCSAPVGPDTIGKLTEPVKEMYESYVLGSFMESNKDSIRWCHAPGCDYAIERHEEDVLVEDGETCLDFGVICLCGHNYCWSCQLEPHLPVTCENAALWCNRTLDVLKNVAWIAENTKPCPRCNTPVQRDANSNLRFMTCICSHSFCWRCFKSEAEHKRRGKCAEVKPKNADSSEMYTHYLSLWESGHEGLEKSKSDLNSIEENVIPRLMECVSHEDTMALKEAWLLMVQCRLVLKWSSVFEYFIHEYQRLEKPFVDHLRRDATMTMLRHKETVEKVMNLAISSGDFTFFKHKLDTSTTTTGNFFHEYVKNLLKDALREVKVDSSENASVSYWLCNRCKVKNSWSDRQCKMCFVHLDSPIPPPHPNVAFDNN
ncbi:hypothetical protein EUTSA_v10013280mg [Eutrema salsugineum]|uniref:RBR-type E3 ubiquitin transferase n=1 Tax=Eutrema salsugineum TaxID=72664 RepID=V4LLY2_EUTSA|nr:probable E3 ubiquitin-protein ligase ARI16 [Eutrema salsugineum]ESQ40838.1 hypothetical protein EUTSA_v10013280mg [Eutrema salsugineum]